MIPQVIFYHCPLLLEACGFHKGRCAFKFENMWLKVEGFVERVQQWWNGYCFVSSCSFILAQKLKDLKVDLKKWNREEIGDLAFREKKKICYLNCWGLMLSKKCGVSRMWYSPTVYRLEGILNI